MNQADQIRQFVLHHHISPARSAGSSEITLRAGDIHNEMGLASRMPAVCSVLDGKKLSDLATISIKRRQGPRQGANVFVTFNLEKYQAQQTNYQPKARPIRTKRSKHIEIDPTTTLVLVSCVKSKLERAAPAQNLYTSALFAGMKSLAIASGAPWFILSAKYGLVHPEKVISPYELTLNTLRVSERRAWAQKVLKALLPKTKGRQKIVVLAGARYREFLIEPLERMGLETLIPMSGLRLGEQLRWLSEQT